MLKILSSLRKFLTTESPLKMMRKERVFILPFTKKDSFRSQDVEIFVLNIWSCLKTA